MSDKDLAISLLEDLLKENDYKSDYIFWFARGFDEIEKANQHWRNAIQDRLNVLRENQNG
jgi:hypothetical protein